MQVLRVSSPLSKVTHDRLMTGCGRHIVRTIVAQLIRDRSEQPETTPHSALVLLLPTVRTLVGTRTHTHRLSSTAIYTTLQCCLLLVSPLTTLPPLGRNRLKRSRPGWKAAGMCYGSAKPVFMSDAPSFLQRQRARAAKHLVSEHTGTITCRCRKCVEAAQAQAGPVIGREWPLPPLEDKDGFLTTLSMSVKPSRASRRDREAEAASDGLVSRDFPWLLRICWEICPSDGPGSGGTAGTVSYDGTWTPDPRSLQGKLGIIVPETVILEKGKPKRRYFLDHAGRIGVVRMKTSAELLRVLRDFVRRAIARCREQRGADRGARLSPCRSEPTLGEAAPAPSAMRQAEVAVLQYNDGLSRQMMLPEAVSQIKGASKLPREFWQRMRMLQVGLVSQKLIGSRSKRDKLVSK